MINLSPGHNCWKTAHADRAAFIVDSAAYYAAFANAVERAQTPLYIKGWWMQKRLSAKP